jgi:hypothetical protein
MIPSAYDVNVSMDEDSSSDDGSDASVHDHDDPDWEMMLVHHSTK